MEASSMLGALSGIGEIAKEAFGDDKRNGQSSSRIPNTRSNEGGDQ
jgi:hypothetical protein